jgi:tetratricopeptide (TPR) repeat protein
MVALSPGGALAQGSKTPFPACTTTPTKADIDGAQKAFELGSASFNEADYGTAITYWRDAYRRDCTAHKILLNLARAYELKGDKSEAVNALETYLQRKPDAPDAESIRRRIENLKSQIAPAAPTPAPPAPTLAPAPAPVAQPPAPETSEHGRSIAPLILAGGGAVVAIVGGVVFAGGAKKVSDFEAACPNRKCPGGDTPADKAHQQDLIQQGNDARNQETLGGVVLGVGAAAIAGGLIWYFVSAPSSSPARASAPPSITPVVTPGFAGLSLAGHF